MSETMIEDRAVSLVGDTLTIDGLRVSTPEVIRAAAKVVERSGGLTDFATGALELGARAINMAGATADIDELRSCVLGLQHQVVANTEASMTRLEALINQATSDQGPVVTAVTESVAGMRSAIEDLFAVENAPAREAIRRTLDEMGSRVLGEVQRTMASQSEALRQVVDSDNPASPLHSMRRELLRSHRDTRDGLEGRLVEIRSLVEVARVVKASVENTTAKGITFERACFATLDALAAGAGDHAEATGALPGLNGRSKKGDIVISCRQPTSPEMPKVVVEVKDQAMGLAAWKRELDDARDNRCAVGALGLVRSADQVPGPSALRVVDPLTMIVAFDAKVDDPGLIQAVYQLLRAQALCSVLPVGGEGLEVRELRARLDNATELLGRFDLISRGLRSARRHVDATTEAADALRADLTMEIRGALAICAEPDAGAAA